MSTITIATEHLVLSPLRSGDARSVFEYRSDPVVCRYQVWQPASVEEVQDFIEKLKGIVPDTPGTWFQLGIRLRSADVLVGDAGLHFPAASAQQAEIGVTVAPAYQGRGDATEAVRGLLGYLFETLGKHRVYASVDPRNQPSLRLLARIGMRREAHFRKSFWFRGEWADEVVFAMLEGEWKALRR